MRRIAISLVAALLSLSALAPAAAADDWPPPNFVAPCFPGGEWNVSLSETLKRPTNDGSHTCRMQEDGSRVLPPPSLYRGSWEDLGTLTVVP